MFKRIILFCALTAPLLASAATATYFPQGITLADVHNAPHILIAWDIHGVLAEKDGGARFGAIMGNIFTLGWSKLTDDTSWDQIDQLKKNSDISGEAYMQVLTKNGNRSAAQATEEAANAYKPRKGMQGIVERLHNAGNTQRLASNIGPRCLQNLERKFSKKKHGCNIFRIIQPGKIVDYSQFGNGSLKTHVDPLYLCSTSKPNSTFYTSFNAAHNPGKKFLVITIDDRMENIEAARAQGIVGIYMDTKVDKPVVALNRELDRLQLFKLRK